MRFEHNCDYCFAVLAGPDIERVYGRNGEVVQYGRWFWPSMSIWMAPTEELYQGNRGDSEMGSRTDASNLAWQLEHANTPPIGKSRKLLERMSALAVELIQTVRLELSGVRNGDGHWDGGQPIVDIIYEINQLLDRLSDIEADQLFEESYLTGQHTEE
jgi:hypothetical protein